MRERSVKIKEAAILNPTYRCRLSYLEVKQRCPSGTVPDKTRSTAQIREDIRCTAVER